VWCGTCYNPLDSNEFPIAVEADEDDLVNEEDMLSTHYLQARNGDNSITPFQCDTCHFRNLMGRNPENILAKDIKLFKCIRRVNLDSVWASEPRKCQEL
jgi:hypothetical protein